MRQNEDEENYIQDCSLHLGFMYLSLPAASETFNYSGGCFGALKRT